MCAYSICTRSSATATQAVMLLHKWLQQHKTLVGVSCCNGCRTFFFMQQGTAAVAGIALGLVTGVFNCLQWPHSQAVLE